MIYLSHSHSQSVADNWDNDGALTPLFPLPHTITHDTILQSYLTVLHYPSKLAIADQSMPSLSLSLCSISDADAKQGMPI